MRRPEAFRIILSTKDTVDKARAFLQEYKGTHPCVACKRQFHWSAMQFDHLPEFEKVDSLSAMSNRGEPVSVLQAEIAKCEVVCATCHLYRTWVRKQRPFVFHEAGSR
jgi:hypothetical protein